MCIRDSPCCMHAYKSKGNPLGFALGPSREHFTGVSAGARTIAPSPAPRERGKAYRNQMRACASRSNYFSSSPFQNTHMIYFRKWGFPAKISTRISIACHLCPLQEAIEAVLEEEQLQRVPSFISKVIQVIRLHHIGRIIDLRFMMSTFQGTYIFLICRA